MDIQSRTMLDEILAKEPAALTDGDKAFLRARQDYLSGEQRNVYAEVLAEQPLVGPDSTEAPAKKTAKTAKTDEALE